MKTLKIQTLEKGWYDRDEILLHASFQILVDYMEKEHPEKIIDWNADETLAKTWKEIKSLFKWWKETRPARINPLDDKKIKVPPLKFKKIPGSDMSELVEQDKKKYAEYFRALKKTFKLEQKWFDEDQRNLHRLIEVRPHLWT